MTTEMAAQRPETADAATRTARADGVRQTAGTAATRAISLLLGMAASIVLARSLQPAGRGTYHVITTVAGTAMMLGHLSVEQAQTTLWADPRRRRAIAANSLTLGLVVGSLAALAAWCVVLFAHSAFGLADPALVGLALVGVPAGICALYLTNIAVLTSRMGLANRALLAGAVVQCGLLIALGLGGRLTVRAVVVLWVVSMVVPCVVLVGTGRLAFRRFDPETARRTLAIGLSYHLGPVSIFLLLRADVLILAAQVPAEVVGVYGLAVSIMEMTKFATDSVAQVALSRQIRRSDRESAAITARMTRLTMLVGLSSALGVVLSAPVVVPALYGRSFSAAVPMLLMLAPGVLALGATRPVNNFLLRTGSSRLVVAPCVIALAVNVVLNVLLIPTLGAMGCCIASSTGYVTMAGLQAWMFVKRSGVRPQELVPDGRDVSAFMSAVKGALRWFPTQGGWGTSG